MAPGGAKLIVAHRGDTSAAHENTLDAFRAAIANGASAIEFDVHMTADGVAVVHHDDDIAGQAIAAMSHAALANVHAAYSIPTLSEVIEVAAGRVRLDIEIKAPASAREVVAQVTNPRVPLDEVVVTAFDAATLGHVRALAPRIRTGWLVEKMSAADALRAFEQSGATFLAPDHTMVDAGLLQEADRLRVPLLPWTVNDPARMQWLLRAPAVIGIITDRLADALAARDAASRHDGHEDV
jgi:glycerophosphoryl diester phosphodiesterase